jgi:hypothetical protein
MLSVGASQRHAQSPYTSQRQRLWSASSTGNPDMNNCHKYSSNPPQTASVRYSHGSISSYNFLGRDRKPADVTANVPQQGDKISFGIGPIYRPSSSSHAFRNFFTSPFCQPTSRGPSATFASRLVGYRRLAPGCPGSCKCH